MKAISGLVIFSQNCTNRKTGNLLLLKINGNFWCSAVALNIDIHSPGHLSRFKICAWFGKSRVHAREGRKNALLYSEASICANEEKMNLISQKVFSDHFNVDSVHKL